MFEGFIGLSFLLSAFNSFVVAVFQFFLSAIFFRIEFSCEDVKIETANIICEKNIPIQCPSLDMKGTEPMMKKNRYSPIPGYSYSFRNSIYFIYDGFIFWVHIEKEHIVYETFFFHRKRLISYAKKFFSKIAGEARQLDKDNWSKTILPKVSYDPQMFDEKLTAKLKGIIDDFKKSNDVKCTILLHGPPGTGKSTLVRHLVEYAGTRICIINSLITSLKYGMYSSTTRRMASDSCVILDDFDITLKELDKDSDFKSDFTAEILAFLDGVNTPRNCIIFLTMNSVDFKCADKILRDGRIDHRFNISYLSYEKAHSIIKDKFKISNGASKRLQELFTQKNITIATLKNRLNSSKNMNELINSL